MRLCRLPRTCSSRTVLPPTRVIPGELDLDSAIGGLGVLIGFEWAEAAGQPAHGNLPTVAWNQGGARGTFASGHTRPRHVTLRLRPSGRKAMMRMADARSWLCDWGVALTTPRTAASLACCSVCLCAPAARPAARSTANCRPLPSTCWRYGRRDCVEPVAPDAAVTGRARGRPAAGIRRRGTVQSSTPAG